MYAVLCNKDRSIRAYTGKDFVDPTAWLSNTCYQGCFAMPIQICDAGWHAAATAYGCSAVLTVIKISVWWQAFQQVQKTVADFTGPGWMSGKTAKAATQVYLAAAHGINQLPADKAMLSCYKSHATDSYPLSQGCQFYIPDDLHQRH